MLKKLLYFEWISKKARCYNFTKSTIKIASTYVLIPILIFICFFDTCRTINNNTYGAVVINISIFILFILQALLNISIKNIRKDPILVFIKKERYIYIKRKVELKIYKAICMFIMPMVLPLIIYSKNKMWILGISLLSIISFYLLNMIIAYAVSYLDAVSNRSILHKLGYILGIITVFLLVFKFKVYMVGEIINGLLKKGKGTFNIYAEGNITTLAITVVISMVLYLIILKLVKDNLYVMLNSLEGNTGSKRSLLNKILKLKIKNLYNKVLIKDLCCFTRKKGIEFYMLVLSQIGTFIMYCFTILQDRPKGVTEKFYLVSGFYVICCFISVFMLIIAVFSNIKEIKLEEELKVIRKFNIKADRFKLLTEKAEYIFILLSLPILATALINFLLDISLIGAAQSILILISILSWLRCCSLMATDIVNLKLNQIRGMIFLGITVLSAKIMMGISFSNEFRNINDLVLKYLLVIFINVLGYYVELLLISFLERGEVNG